MAESDHKKHNAGNLWLPITSVIVMLGVVGGAAVTWATDRAELHSGTTKNTQQDARIDAQQTAIDQLRLDQAARSARDEDMRRRIDDMQKTLDRIAERVGAKP